MTMREVTAWFIIAAPIVILLVDIAVFAVFGEDATITGVVRYWSKKTAWPEFAYVVFTAALYVHLFRSWPDGK